MTSFLIRNIPPRVVLAAGAMSLLVSVVLGRENPEPPAVVALAAATVAAGTTESVADLDLQQLKRSRKSEDIADLFAPRQRLPVTLPEPVNAEPPAPPAPSAPPLPFTYLGKFIDGEKMEVFIAQGNEHYSIEKGKTIDDRYKVEKVTETAVTFVYLPLGTRQSLAIPSLK